MSIFKEHQQLQERLRILILRHRSEEMDYDESFLNEMQSVSRRLLELKRQLSLGKGSKFIFPLKEKNTGRLRHYL